MKTAPNTLSLGFLITKIGRMATKKYADRLEAISLTPLQAGVLGTLASVENCNQKKLMSILQADKGTIHQTLKGLEKRKLISSTPSNEDKRHLRIAITNSGTKLVSTILAIDAEVSKELEEMLSSKSRKLLSQSLLELYLASSVDSAK